jgi:peptidoglycan/xylan/chitin deacetylase (PgdA/CDA1 family)
MKTNYFALRAGSRTCRSRGAERQSDHRRLLEQGKEPLRPTFSLSPQRGEGWGEGCEYPRHQHDQMAVPWQAQTSTCWRRFPKGSELPHVGSYSARGAFKPALRRQARWLQPVFLPIMLLALALPLRAASDPMTAKLDCSGLGSGWYEDEYGWQSLDFNLELHFTLKGVYAQQDGDLSLYQLTNKTGSIHFWGTAYDSYFSTTEHFDFRQSLELGNISGVLNYVAKSNRVTYVGFSLEQLAPSDFEPYHVRFYDSSDSNAPFVRTFIHLPWDWLFDDYADVTGTARVRPFMLTFDDGPMSGTTDVLLNRLGQVYAQGRLVKAGFFMVGDNDSQWHAVEPWHNKGSVVANPALVRTAALAGHAIGNHTQHHADYRKYVSQYGVNAPQRYAQDEIAACDAALTQALGQPAFPKLFRPPYLIEGDGVRQAAALAGHKVIMGKTVGDYLYALGPSFTHVALTKGHAATVLKNWQSQEPCILIFHDLFPEICDHISEIVEYLRGQGYTLVNFDPDASSVNREFTDPPMVCSLQSFDSQNLFLVAPMPFKDHSLSLEATDDLSSALRWRTSSSEPMLVDDLYVFPLPKSQPREFYRVRMDSASP